MWGGHKYFAGQLQTASVTMETLSVVLLHAGKTVAEIIKALGTSRSFVFKIKKLVEQGKDLTVVRRGGPPRKKRTARKIASVARAVEKNPRKSIRRLAAGHGMSERTMRRLLKEDLGLKSRVVQSRPLLTASAKEKRVERARELVTRQKHPDAGKVRIFSDEKIFTVDAAINRRNSRYLSDLPVTNVNPNIRISHGSWCGGQ